MFSTEDTIAAISTAAGSADLAIVRLSGPAAIEIASAVFAPCEGKLSDCAGFRWMRGLVRLQADCGQANDAACSRVASHVNEMTPSLSLRAHDNENDTARSRVAAGSEYSCELPAAAYVFRAPRSYTRQDICELHIPGPAAAANWLLQTVLRSGARQARPGEFTARAFFSGRIDLSAAEGVADIIDAASQSQLRSGLSALGGAIHRFCSEASDSLAEMLASVEASIDLADEDIALDAPAEIAARLARLSDRLARFARRAADVPDHARQMRLAIAGRPNAGKSTLLNLLALSDRAIVSDQAGTTRDVLTAQADLCGQLVLVQDLAGLAEATDSLTAAGQGAARAAISVADAVVFVADLADADISSQLELLSAVRRMNARAPLLLLANKIDAVDDAQARRRLRQWSKSALTEPLAVSALKGTGIDALRVELSRRLRLEAPRSADALGLHLRQKQCLLSAGQCVRRAGDLVREAPSVADVAELAAVELRGALAELGLISGQVATEEILGRIFRRFCVGK